MWCFENPFFSCSQYSVQGRQHRQSYLYQHRKPFGVYSVIAMDACPNPGPKRPYNFFGVVSSVSEPGMWMKSQKITSVMKIAHRFRSTFLVRKRRLKLGSCAVCLIFYAVVLLQRPLKGERKNGRYRAVVDVGRWSIRGDLCI